MAAKAYESYNSELAASGLAIHTPLTVRDVEFGDLAGWVAKLGGFACIKVPYSNAGQGVYTITCDEEARAAGGWCFACVRSDATCFCFVLVTTSLRRSKPPRRAPATASTSCSRSSPTTSGRRPWTGRASVRSAAERRLLHPPPKYTHVMDSIIPSHLTPSDYRIDACFARPRGHHP